MFQPLPYSLIVKYHILLNFTIFQQNFPRTLEALMLHLLSPVGAEVLTRKFDEMDQLIVEEDRYVLIHADWLVYSYERVCCIQFSLIIYLVMFLGTNSTRFFMVYLMTSLLQWMRYWMGKSLMHFRYYLLSRCGAHRKVYSCYMYFMLASRNLLLFCVRFPLFYSLLNIFVTLRGVKEFEIEFLWVHDHNICSLLFLFSYLTNS